MRHTNQTNPVFRIPTYEREEVTALLKKDSAVFQQFQALTPVLREELISFCMGNRGLKITYDPFFKEIFNPVYHRERLERLISCILGEKVRIKKIRPTESRRLSSEASLIIMDILVELESGGLVNVEIQRVSYDFPGPRGACYSSDLVMRQYAAVKAEREQAFSYRDLGKVITIVIVEKSSGAFLDNKDHYIHHFKQTSDTGLELDLLQEYIFITLDVYQEITHNISTELEAWMTFLSTDNPSDIMALTEAYPYFKELYSDMIAFQRKPKELVNMFSEALEIMDRNTVKYMIEDRDEKIRQKEAQFEEQASEIKHQAGEIEHQASKIEHLASENEQLVGKIEEQTRLIHELMKRIDTIEAR